MITTHDHNTKTKKIKTMSDGVHDVWQCPKCGEYLQTTNWMAGPQCPVCKTTMERR